MALFTKPDAYQKQITIYLNNKNYESAYDLAKEFSERFGQELTSHFLLSKSAFWMKKYPEAIVAGRKAFNMAHAKEDMILCGIILSTAYYMQGDVKNSQEVLEAVNRDGNTDVEKLMFICALAVQDEKAAMEHVNRLYKINRRMAEDFVMKFF
ncbi:MAG: CDC27 family protein [Candidatus Micrarchaeota archaeon]|nr:CDC27 family protein [Candidatus Micrarchaeota archaeon]